MNEEESTFKVGLAPETLRRTYLGSMEKGDKLNKSEEFNVWRAMMKMMTVSKLAN